MMQLSLIPVFDRQTFSPEVAKERKDSGRKRAVKTHNLLLIQVKCGLIDIARSRPSRTATADDGQAWLIANGHSAEELGNAAGSMFADDCWECIGRVKSTRVSRHANEIRLWRLR